MAKYRKIETTAHVIAESEGFMHAARDYWIAAKHKLAAGFGNTGPRQYVAGN